MRITCNYYNNRRTHIKYKNKNELLTTESLLIVAKAMPMQVFHHTIYCPLMHIPFCHRSTKLHNNQSIPDYQCLYTWLALSLTYTTWLRVSQD